MSKVLGRKINIRAIGSVLVGDFAIFVRVTSEGLGEKMAVETWRRQGNKPGKRRYKVQWS